MLQDPMQPVDMVDMQPPMNGPHGNGQVAMEMPPMELEAMEMQQQMMH